MNKTDCPVYKVLCLSMNKKILYLTKNGLFYILAPHFEDGKPISTLDTNNVREASGLCASRIHPNILYTHNDSGDHTHSIYAIDVTSGHEVAKITINHAVNKDWEDIACGPCGGNHGDYCIYIADTGGNVHDAANIIYRIKEPEHLQSQITVDLDSTLKFRYLPSFYTYCAVQYYY